jgi:hypothetical protein
MRPTPIGPDPACPAGFSAQGGNPQGHAFNAPTPLPSHFMEVLFRTV